MFDDELDARAIGDSLSGSAHCHGYAAANDLKENGGESSDPLSLS